MTLNLGWSSVPAHQEFLIKIPAVIYGRLIICILIDNSETILILHVYKHASLQKQWWDISGIV